VREWELYNTPGLLPVRNGAFARVQRGARVKRERVAFVVLVTLLVFLFAFVFAVLGKGTYETNRQEPSQLASFSWVAA
jgi:hypothetical protein